MRDRILELIEQLEVQHDFTVVDARDVGSRAWGLDGPESDYDVGLIFVHDPINYATLGEVTKTVEQSFDEEDIEFKGFDISKFARLLQNSNESAVSYLFSDESYMSRLSDSEDGVGISSLRTHISEEFDPMSLYHSYRGLAANNYHDYLSHHLVDPDKNVYSVLEDRDEEFVVEGQDGDRMTVSKRYVEDVDGTEPEGEKRYQETQVKQTVKKNLVIARAVLYGQFIKATGEEDEHSLPEMHFPTFLDEQADLVISAETREEIERLIELKRSGDGSKNVGDVFGEEFTHLEKQIDPDIHAAGGPDREVINEFVRTAVRTGSVGE